MKKTFMLILAALMLTIALAGCGRGNNTQPDTSADKISNQEQAVTISGDWLGTYHSTDGDKDIKLNVTSTGGTVEIDGSSTELTARAEYDNEIQLIDGDGSVVHLTRFSDNPVDKRYDFAATAKGDPATQIIGSTFMQRDGDAAASEQPANDNSQSSVVPDSNVPDSNISDSGVEVFPYIDITYRAQEYDGILIFQKPNEEGLPTEMVVDGKTYALEDFYMIYDAAQDTWTGGGTGNNPDGSIGYSLSGNNKKWMLWLSGALNMTSAYFGDGDQSGNDTGNSAKSYSFLGIVYKNEDLYLTFKLQMPDGNGYPTEIVINGVTYDETVTFDNETYSLEKVDISEAFGSTEVTAEWRAKGRGFGLHLQSDGDSWKMVGPAICSGYYHPE